MMLVEETTVPTAALPVAAFKDHLRLGTGFADDDVQDALLERHLRAALAAIEARTGKILIARSFSWTVNAWRDAYQQPLPAAPIEVITGVMLISATGAETIAPSIGWRLQQDSHRPMLVGVNGALPVIPQNGQARVGFIAGFGPTAVDVPADLMQALLLLATHFYEFRHDSHGSGREFPFGVGALIAPYRNVRLFMGGRS